MFNASHTHTHVISPFCSLFKAVKNSRVLMRSSPSDASLKEDKKSKNKQKEEGGARVDKLMFLHFLMFLDEGAWPKARRRAPGQVPDCLPPSFRHFACFHFRANPNVI